MKNRIRVQFECFSEFRKSTSPIPVLGACQQSVGMDQDDKDDVLMWFAMEFTPVRAAKILREFTQKYPEKATELRELARDFMRRAFRMREQGRCFDCERSLTRCECPTNR